MAEIYNIGASRIPLWKGWGISPGKPRRQAVHELYRIKVPCPEQVENNIWYYKART